MSTATSLPDIGAALQPIVETLPPEMRPGVIANLERAAAERYDAWAAACKDIDVTDGLRACAGREREVARRVESILALPAGAERQTGEALGRIAEAYRAAMGNRPVREQYAIQAAAERSGAAFWRAIAASLDDPAMRDTLEGCAGLEEESAMFLESLLDKGLA